MQEIDIVKLNQAFLIESRLLDKLQKSYNDSRINSESILQGLKRIRNLIRYYKVEKRLIPHFDTKMAINNYHYTILRIQEKKEQKKLDFQNKFRFQIWFMQTTLGADYGQFECNKCGRIFYHSPTRVYKAKQKLFNCACGHCVNNMASSNGDEEIFY